jgi:isopenicillin N synthase-like dioxygenase
LPREGQIVVNFGRLLALWTCGRIVACEHRVLSPNRERFSIPFFYELRLDYEITPLPLGDAAPFAPSYTATMYGRHRRGCNACSGIGRAGEVRLSRTS